MVLEVTALLLPRYSTGRPIVSILICFMHGEIEPNNSRCCSNGGWKPIYASRGGPPITSLFFADDLILFGVATMKQARIMKCCLDKFCTAWGQRVSFAKSLVFFSKNTTNQMASEISTELNIPMTSYLGRYLGMYTINGRVTKQTFRHVSDRIDARLAGWKSRCLSLAGRATLVQSTISSIPYYAMQTARLLRSLCDDCDRKARRFLWGGSADNHKIHNVVWNQVTMSKEARGLGFRTKRQANLAFMTKSGGICLLRKTPFGLS